MTDKADLSLSDAAPLVTDERLATVLRYVHRVGNPHPLALTYDETESVLRELQSRRSQAQSNDHAATESGVATPQTASHPSLPALTPSTNPSWSRELVKEIAMDVGKDVCGYVEWMYPKAVEATSSTFLLSLRNSIHNQIMAALDGPTDEVSIRERLAARKTWRRKFKALWKKGREMPEHAWESAATHEMGAEWEKK